MDRAVLEWTNDDGDRTLSSLNHKVLAKSLNKSYTVYGDLLLLPSSALKHDELEGVIARDDGEEVLQRLYKCISKHLKVTHIATSHPIPLHSDGGKGEENVIRSPTNFQPIFGDFGPSTSNDPPTQADFDAAFWVTAKQNGIFQAWAPRWTMFSRGNVKEKARVLSLPSVQLAVDQGRGDGRGCAAVDLYAGIGYFAFSYLKAGVQKVICWDLNPWSCEGLARGAKANKWTVAHCKSDEDSGSLAAIKASQLVVYNESNDRATSSLNAIRAHIPPVRHVNCGLLPTSAGSWQTAVQALDPGFGGWLHIHENFAANEIEQRAEDVRQAIEQISSLVFKRCQIELEHIERVKTYAPGVWHCVLDVRVTPKLPA